MTAPAEKQQARIGLTERRRLPSRRDEQRSRDLAELSASLAASIANTDEVLERVVHLASSFLGDAAVVQLFDDDTQTMQVVAAYDQNDRALDVIRRALESVRVDAADSPPHPLVSHSPRSLMLTGDQLDAAMTAMAPEHREALHEIDLQGVLASPLRAHGRVIGTLGLWRRGGGGAHSTRDQNFAQELADRAALAIESARLVERLRAEVEERKENEENLRVTAELLQHADQQRKALMENLVSAQEEERRRIAVDVHDDSIQSMAAIGLRLQILRRHAPSREFAERVAEIENTVTESIGRLRSLLFRLESVSLEKVGLARTIDRYAAELFPDGHPRFAVRSELQIEPPPHVQVTLYRIAQEALANVQKHALAGEVALLVSEAEDGISLSVRDDGIGFDREDVIKRALPGHLGLRSMQERAEIAGGWLTVDSAAGSGTLIRTWVPR
ncbi:MAG TPA: GAF domain-containing sensor histidine kinase [Candidatus Dormibacteraeota bacterium]